MSGADDTRAQVLVIVACNRGCQVEALKDNLDLYWDLGLYGDDAVDLFLTLQRELEIDFSGLELRRHFPGEGGSGWLLRLIPIFKGKWAPLRIVDLIAAAERKAWLGTSNSSAE